MSENSWWDDLSDSAKTFDKVVWPEVEKVLHGRLEHVEAATDDRFKECLDQYSGIDAWHILDSTGVIRGIPSCVQARPVGYYGAFPYNTFTVRRSRNSGSSTK